MTDRLVAIGLGLLLLSMIGGAAVLCVLAAFGAPYLALRMMAWVAVLGLSLLGVSVLRMAIE
jgi:hypothetical protein